MGTKIGKNWTTKKEIGAFVEVLEKFVEDGLEKEVKGVFSKKTNLLTVRLEENQYPILLKTHHKTFEDTV